jgi:hypothetical protein
MILGIVSDYFVVYEAYFVLVNFCRTISAANIYFVVYALFSHL